MPEPIGSRPGRCPSSSGRWARTLRRLSALPSNDTVLAERFAARRSCSAWPGWRARDRAARDIRQRAVAHRRRRSGAVRAAVRGHAAAAWTRSSRRGRARAHQRGPRARSGPAHAAAGRARRHLVPVFGLEMFRVAANGPRSRCASGAGGVEAVAVGDLVVPTEPDGRVWVHFSRHDPARFVSAADVLGGRIDARIARGPLVLIGVDRAGPLGLPGDAGRPIAWPASRSTPSSSRTSVDGEAALPARARRGIEVGLLAAAACCSCCGAAAAGADVGGAVVLLVGGGVALGFVALSEARDPAGRRDARPWPWPLLFTVMLVVTLTETESQRRALRRRWSSSGRRPRGWPGS